MGKLFRRALAFVLGMVFGVTALLGSVVGGAFWAYKNVKPLDIANENDTVQGLGDLETASVEELLNLIADAINSPDEYKFKRLEKEYGLDLESLLASLGVDTSDAKQVDLDAIRDIPIFALASNMSQFLDGVKFRAIYVFIPKLTGKSVDELLSKEAQAKLGECSLLELFTKDELTEEVGLVKMLKNLKVGSILPSLFDAEYVRDTHEYNYTLKEGTTSPLGMLGNVYIGTLFDMAGGSSLINELMSGGLQSIADMSLRDLLTSLTAVASSDVANLVSQRAQALGDTTLRDLFKNVDGEYQFTTDVLLENIELGYLLGLYKDDDGIWYKDAELTTPAEGLQNALATSSLKDIIDNKGDMRTMLVTAFGDVTFEDLAKLFADEEKIPEGMKALYGITVEDVFGEGNVGENLRKQLSTSLEGVTIAELFNLNPDSVALKSIYSIDIGKLLDPSATSDDILKVVQNALNGVAIGDLLGYERDGNGNWNATNVYLLPFLDVTFGEAPAGISLLSLMSVFSDMNVTEMAQALFGGVTVGNVFGYIFKYEYDEVNRNWFKTVTVEDEDGNTTETTQYLDSDFAEALHIKVWQLFAALDKTNDYVIFDDLKDLSIGEVVYSMLLASNKLPSGLVKVKASDFKYLENMEEDGYAFTNDDIRQLSEILFQITFGEIREHRSDRSYWMEKLKPVTGKSILGMFLSDSREESNAIIKGTLGVSIGELIELTNDDDDKSGRQVLSEIIKNHFDVVTLDGVETKVYVGDLLQLFKSNWRNNSSLEAIGNLEFAKSVCAILGTESKREVFGDLTLEDLVGGYIPTKLKKSDLVNATLTITVAQLYDFNSNRKLSYLFHEILEPAYEGLTIMDCVDDFKNYGEKLEAYDAILSFELTNVMHAMHTKEYGTLLSDFKTAFKKLDRNQKVIVMGASAGAVAALYELDDSTLVKLLGDVFDDATWGEYVADALGYEMVDGNWTISGVYNALADKFLKQEIRVTLDKTQCSLKKDYLEEMTVGSLVASNKKVVAWAEKFGTKFRAGTLASDDDGIYMAGSYENLTKIAFSLKVFDIYRNRGNITNYVLDNFGDLLIGDVGTYAATTTLKKFKFEQTVSYVDGAYVVDGAFRNISEKVYNTTLKDFYKTKTGFVKNVIKEAMIGDVLADVLTTFSAKEFGGKFVFNATLSEDGSTWTALDNYDEFLTVLYNLKVSEVRSGFKASGIKYFASEDAFGNIRLGYLFAYGNNVYDEENGMWLDENGDALVFEGSEGAIRRTIYNLKVSDVLVDGFNFKTLVNGLYLGELMGYDCQLSGVGGHEHNDDCVWFETTNAYVLGEEENGLQEVTAKLKPLEQTIASLSLQSVLEDGLTVSKILEGNKLGDLIGYASVSEQEGEEETKAQTTWFEYLTAEDGNIVVTAKDYGERVISDKQVSTLAQTFADIDASDLTSKDAINIIINKFKGLKLGEVLEYEQTEVDGETIWLKKNADGTTTKVDGALQKLASHTVSEIENNLSDIINDWSISDVLSAEMISGNTILSAVKDVKLGELSSAINDIDVGVAMGYDKKSDGKWYNADGTIVTDEIMLVLADYKIGNLTGAIALSSGKTFAGDIIDSMLNNVSIGTIYPDAGKSDSDGLMSILDPSWKLKDLSTNLMNKLKTSMTINQLIDLGVFGDYFVPQEGYDSLTTPGSYVDEETGEKVTTNYGLIDSIFKTKVNDGEDVRAYWLALSMPEFMNSILQSVTIYQQWFIDNSAALEAAGIQLPTTFAA